MDIRSLSDVQKQLFERVIQKLIARNHSPSDISQTQKLLLDSLRDSKNFHMIMEKLKDCGAQIELDNFDENFKEGNSDGYVKYSTDRGFFLNNLRPHTYSYPFHYIKKSIFN